MRAASDARLPVTSLLVWDKEWIGAGGPQGLRPSYELVALMARPGFTIPDRGVPDIWRHKVGSHKPNGHPAEKPVALVERILRTAAVPPGEFVLDPFRAFAARLLRRVLASVRVAAPTAGMLPVTGSKGFRNVMWCHDDEVVRWIRRVRESSWRRPVNVK